VFLQKLRNYRGALTTQLGIRPPYLVPLSVQAQEIVRYLLEQVKPVQRYLLPHRSDLKVRISENTLNGALKRMGYADQLTGHGIRGTISTAYDIKTTSSAVRCGHRMRSGKRSDPLQGTLPR